MIDENSAENIPAALRALIEPGAVIEIRIPEPANGYPLFGYFSDLDLAAAAAKSWSGKCSGVYFTPNPINTALLARANNRLRQASRKGGGSSTSDSDILARRWLLIDIDPVRPAGISSSNTEHEAALTKAQTVRDWLTTQGWPMPISADSGNGAHLLYRVNLPNDADARALVETCLKALAARFDDHSGNGTQCPVKVDTSVFNAGRIWKLYGTLACKGDNTTERPYRLARILDAPDHPVVVTAEQLHALATLTPQPDPKPKAEWSIAPAGDFFGNVNSTALARLSDWVPALFPDAKTYRNGYRVTSKSLARGLEEDLAIQSDGIVDFGLHDQGDAQSGRRTAIDLVIEHGATGSAKDAALWLCRQLAVEPELLGWKGRPDGRTYGQATIAKAIASNRETYSGRRQQADNRPEAGAAGADMTKAIPDDDLFSDYGNVVKLRNRLSGRLAYSPGLNWLLYCPDTGVWEPEPGAERVKNLVLETLREEWGKVLDKAAVKSESIRKQRKELDEDDPATATLDKRMKSAAAARYRVEQWLRQCETAYRIRSTLEIAEGFFWTRPEMWDNNPHILVCNNGVLDLVTGRLLPHSPDYRATKTTGTDFIPSATHPAWDAVVALLQAEGDRYSFIHQYCGSGLHGENPNERAVIFQGDGGTGKGTLLTAIHRALGAYVETVDVVTLLATDWRKQNKSAPREDLLKLRGARFVYPSLEPPKDSKIDDASFKALVGNDAIDARYPHEKKSIKFRPVFKLVIQTNFPLRTEFNDPGMKRRVVVVPFNQKPDRPDPAIKNALINDPTARAACLAWLFEGYRAWRANGFDLPVSALATEATAEYWREMNPFEQFAADVGLRFGKGLKCQKARLNGVFKAWREESGRTDARHREFPRWLVSMGCWEGWDSNKNREWHGVELGDLPPLPPIPPPEIENKVVDFDTLKPIDEFHRTTSGIGGSGGNWVRNGNIHPADALSSHHGDASKPVDSKNSANSAHSGERKPPTGDESTDSWEVD